MEHCQPVRKDYTQSDNIGTVQSQTHNLSIVEPSTELQSQPDFHATQVQLSRLILNRSATCLVNWSAHELNIMHLTSKRREENMLSVKWFKNFNFHNSKETCAHTHLPQLNCQSSTKFIKRIL